VRLFVKQKVKKRSRLAYNAIKFGTIALVLAGLYYAL